MELSVFTKDRRVERRTLGSSPLYDVELLTTFGLNKELIEFLRKNRFDLITVGLNGSSCYVAYRQGFIRPYSEPRKNSEGSDAVYYGEIVIGGYGTRLLQGFDIPGGKKYGETSLHEHPPEDGITEVFSNIQGRCTLHADGIPISLEGNVHIVGSGIQHKITTEDKRTLNIIDMVGCFEGLSTVGHRYHK